MSESFPYFVWCFVRQKRSPRVGHLISFQEICIASRTVSFLSPTLSLSHPLSLSLSLSALAFTLCLNSNCLSISMSHSALTLSLSLSLPPRFSVLLNCSVLFWGGQRSGAIHRRFIALAS